MAVKYSNDDFAKIIKDAFDQLSFDEVFAEMTRFGLIEINGRTPKVLIRSRAAFLSRYDGWETGQCVWGMGDYIELDPGVHIWIGNGIPTVREMMAWNVVAVCDRYGNEKYREFTPAMLRRFQDVVGWNWGV